MNPNDEIRAQILRYFYDRNAKATSQYGKKGSAAKISDVKKELKELHALKQAQVISNLTYLIDKGWINRTEIEKTVKVRGGTVPSTVTWYEISAAGIDKIEGESEFKVNPRYAGININAKGQNVITLGDGNIVNAQYAALRAELESLREDIVATGEIEEEAKFDAVTDIDTITDQLAKRQPNATVIKQLWSGVKAVATTAGLVEAVAKIASMIDGMFP